MTAAEKLHLAERTIRTARRAITEGASGRALNALDLYVEDIQPEPTDGGERDELAAAVVAAIVTGLCDAAKLKALDGAALTSLVAGAIVMGRAALAEADEARRAGGEDDDAS
jgi:acyl transferase domain-containing protein